jgi:hypothetical protein
MLNEPAILTVKSLTEATLIVFDAMPAGDFFYGNELAEAACKINSELDKKYVDTFLRMLRRHRHDKYTLYDRNRSLYRKNP